MEEGGPEAEEEVDCHQAQDRTEGEEDAQGHACHAPHGRTYQGQDQVGRGVPGALRGEVLQPGHHHGEAAGELQ